MHALEFFGGAPEICVPDNLRSAVTRANRYEPDINATYQEFAEHYSMAIVPARPYKPRDKAKVEAAVLMAERWIIAVLRNRRFTSLAGGQRRHRGLHRVDQRPALQEDGRLAQRALLETLDRPALRPLPPVRYGFASWKKAKVNIDYHVEIDKHYYSVPYQLARAEVYTRTADSTVEVFYKSRRVASHVRSFVPCAYSTDHAHMPEAHRRHAEWTPSRIVAWAEATGPSTAALVAGILERRRHPEQGYRAALGIIRLGARHGTDRCEAACARALALGAVLLSLGAVDPRPQPRPPAACPTSALSSPIPTTATSAVARTTAEEEIRPCSPNPPPKACSRSTWWPWPRDSPNSAAIATTRGSASKSA